MPRLFAEDDAADGGQTVEGTVERIVYSSEESGWTVARLSAASGERLTAVGRLPGLRPGERVRLTGRWQRDSRFGRQFQADTCLPLRPETRTGLEKYLGSGLIDGIGKVMAKRLVKSFGLAALDVIEREPERLTEVPGIGPVRARKIQQAWRRQSGMQEAMVFFRGHGLSTRQGLKLIRLWGDDAVAVVQRNPFRLATEVFGIGFQRADQLASSLGLAADAPQRLAAGLHFTLDRAADRGHVYLPRRRLLEEAGRLLAAEPAPLGELLDTMIADGRLRSRPGPDGEAVLLPELERAEADIAAGIERLAAAGEPWEIDAPRAVAAFERTAGIELAPEQRRAVELALSEPLLVITGGPGTGKTTLIRAVVAVLGGVGRKVQLAAPTGRAANRLSLTAGAEARTLHRLLEYDPHRHGFRRGRDNPLEADLVIVDEASMLDTGLTERLLEAIPGGTRLVLVGDVDQLPSVGPGRVLHDLIRSRRLPVARLERIFRQAAESLIVANAHRILHGELPRLNRAPDADFHFFERREPEDVLATVEQLVAERVPRGFGFDPRRDIQVLSPMRRGLLGVDNLNQELQRLINPAGEPVAEGHRLRLGDRVMQTRNNYDLEVFNGDVGRVERSESGGRRVAVRYDDRVVVYEAAMLDELTVAYACSVHKSQGSEYACVVMPIHPQHHLMLQRNLLYTAVTRGRRLVILVGDRRALATAVRNRRTEQRYTLLAERLGGR